MAVLGGVANVLHFRLAQLGEAGFDGFGDLGGIVHAQCGLRHQGEFFSLQGLHFRHICHTVNQVNAAAELPHGALHFGMAGVADHDEFVAFGI